MKLGLMDRKVNILQPVTVRDEYGGTPEDWEPLHSGIWARRMPISAREVVASKSEQVVAGITMRYQIRYRANVRNGMQLRIEDLEDGLVYNIKHVAELGRREGLDILGEALGQT